MTNIREVLSRYVTLSPEVEIEVIKAMKQYTRDVLDEIRDNPNDFFWASNERVKNTCTHRDGISNIDRFKNELK